MTKFARVCCSLVVVIVSLSHSTGHADVQTRTVYGAFVLAPCIPTAITPPPVPPALFPATRLSLKCASKAVLDGALVGVDDGKFTGSIDVVTGNASGTTDEWFYGTSTVSTFLEAGAIHLKGSVVLDGPSGGFHETATIVGGTCTFAGSTGTFRADGVFYGAAAGTGGYTLTWTRPVTPPDIQSCDPTDLVPTP